MFILAGLQRNSHLSDTDREPKKILDYMTVISFPPSTNYGHKHGPHYRGKNRFRLKQFTQGYSAEKRAEPGFKAAPTVACFCPYHLNCAPLGAGTVSLYPAPKIWCARCGMWLWAAENGYWHLRNGQLQGQPLISLNSPTQGSSKCTYYGPTFSGLNFSSLPSLWE